MTDAMWERVEAYTHSAITGLLANPSYSTPESKRYLESKRLSIERLAIISAMEIVQQLEIFKQAKKNQEEKSKPALVEL